MDSATYVYKVEDRVKLGAPTPMVMVKTKHVTEAGLPALFAAARRSYFYNRRASCVTCLSRRGTKEDTDLGFDVSGLFSTFELDVAIAAGRKGEIALIELKPTADGQNQLTVLKATAPAEVTAAAFIGGAGESVALLANGAVVRISADLKTITEIRKPIACKGSFIDAHGDFVLAPSRDGIDVLSLSTQKSALAAAWVPHSAAEPITAVHIFRHWRPNGSNIVMTVGAKGAEVRLWTGLGNSSLELAAHLSLDLPKDLARTVAVADREENVLIGFGDSVLVLSTDERRIKFARATVWENTTGSAVAFAAYNEMTKSGDYQLVMTTRDADSILSVRLPPAIFGAPNLSAAASPAAADSNTAAAGAANYFAAAAKSASSAVVVSSSLGGVSTVAAADSGAAEKAAAASIAAVSTDVIRKVTAVKATVADANKHVAALVGDLQTPATQANAARIGKEFATRNASRFTTAAPAAAAAAAPAAAGGADKRASEQLDLICAHIQTAVSTGIANRANTVVAPRAKAAVEAIGGDADVADLPMPKLSAVASMQTFNASIDKALKVQNDYLKSEADNRASTYNAQVVRSGTATRTAIADSKKFLATLKAELAGLTSEIEAAKVALSTAGDRAAIGAVSGVNAVAEAVALAEKKDYEGAVTKVTQTRDVQLLLEFLGHPAVKAATDAGALSPASISAPAFGTVISQLANGIETSKGHIAPRVSSIYTLCMDWDDYIDETFEGADEKAKSVLNTLAPAIHEARRSLESLPKDDVSIESRRQARTASRVLAKFE